MNRREFSLQLAGVAGAAALASLLPGLALASPSAPVEGTDYDRLKTPLNLPRTGRIEVIEFFWYGCPHCNHFEPTIEPWIARLPATDVHFRRVHVQFNALQAIHQRIYYTWEMMGLVEQMHAKTFERFHVQKKSIDSLEDMLVFAKENGLDTAKVESAWRSFGMDVKCKEANRLEDAYGIEYMPEMAVGGRFIAIAQPAAGHASVLATTEWLVDRVRHGR